MTMRLLYLNTFSPFPNNINKMMTMMMMRKVMMRRNQTRSFLTMVR